MCVCVCCCCCCCCCCCYTSFNHSSSVFFSILSVGIFSIPTRLLLLSSSLQAAQKAPPRGAQGSGQNRVAVCSSLRWACLSPPGPSQWLAGHFPRCLQPANHHRLACVGGASPLPLPRGRVHPLLHARASKRKGRAASSDVDVADGGQQPVGRYHQRVGERRRQLRESHHRVRQVVNALS